MKNKDLNLRLSQYFILLLAIALLTICFATPKIVPWFAQLRNELLEGCEPLLFITVYSSVLPASFLLYFMHTLLKNINDNQVFTPNNVKLLKHISNCCLIETVILALSGLYYPTFGIMAVLAVFMSLILRVVSSVFRQAVDLKDDNDLTI